MSNNSYFAIEQVHLEPETDTIPESLVEVLKEREGVILKILEAVKVVKKSKEWSTLKTLVFDSLASELERAITTEAKTTSPDTLKLNRLTGQLKWAERYSDLEKFENDMRTELSNIRLRYGTTKETNGSP